MNNSNISPSGSTKEPIHVACLKVSHIGDNMWNAFLKYIRSRIESTRSLEALKGKTRAIKVTAYDFKDKLPSNINFTLVLLCGSAPTCRSEAWPWVKGLKSLPKKLQDQDRHLNVILCMGISEVQVGDYKDRINVLPFGIERHVMAFQRESKSLATIKKALIKQLE